MATIGEFILQQSDLGPGNTIGDMLLNAKATIDSNEIVEGTITSAGNIDAGSIASAGGIDFFAGCPNEGGGDGLTIPVRDLSGYTPIAAVLPDFSDKPDRVLDALNPVHHFLPSVREFIRDLNYGEMAGQTTLYQAVDVGSSPASNTRRSGSLSLSTSSANTHRFDGELVPYLQDSRLHYRFGNAEASQLTSGQMTIAFLTRREFQVFSTRQEWLVAWVTGPGTGSNDDVLWGLLSASSNDMRFYARDASGTLQQTDTFYLEPEESRLGSGDGIEVPVGIVCTVDFNTRRVRIYFDNGREGMLNSYEAVPTPIFLPVADYSNITGGTTGHFTFNAEFADLDDDDDGYWRSVQNVAMFDSIIANPSQVEQDLYNGQRTTNGFDANWIFGAPFVDVPENHTRVIERLAPFMRFSLDYAEPLAAYSAVEETFSGLSGFADPLLVYRKQIVYESEVDSTAYDLLITEQRAIRGDGVGLGWDAVKGLPSRMDSGAGGLNGNAQWSMACGYYEKDFDPTCNFFHFGRSNNSLNWSFGNPEDRGVCIYRKDGAMYAQIADVVNSTYYYLPFIGLEDETTALANGWKTGEIVYLTLVTDLSGTGRMDLYCNDVSVGYVDLTAGLPNGFAFSTATGFTYLGFGDSTALNNTDTQSTRVYVGTPERRGQEIILFDKLLSAQDISDLAESFHKTSDDLINNVSYQSTADPLLGTILCGGSIDVGTTPTDGTIEVGTIAPAGTIDPV